MPSHLEARRKSPERVKVTTCHSNSHERLPLTTRLKAFPGGTKLPVGNGASCCSKQLAVQGAPWRRWLWKVDAALVL